MERWTMASKRGKPAYPHPGGKYYLAICVFCEKKYRGLACRANLIRHIWRVHGV